MRFPMNAYEQGQMAKYDGMPITINPYSVMTSDGFAEWVRGYEEGGWEDKQVVAEYELDGNTVVVYRTGVNSFHIDSGDREDIHGQMTSEGVMRWMANVIHNLCHTVKASA